MDANRRRVRAACQSIALIALLAMLAGCGERNPSVAPANPAGVASVAAAAPATVPAAPIASATSAAVATPATTADAAPAAMPATSLALDPEGLRIFVTSTGASRLLAFGAAQADVGPLLARVLPEPQQAHPEDTDCGAVLLLPRSGLRVYFRDGAFTGWGVDAASPLTTAAGIGVGSTRTALEAVVVPEMLADSSLGDEFSAGGIAGLFASAAKDAKITHLWAGDTCIAR